MDYMDYHHPSLNDESDWCSKKMKDTDTVFAVFYDQKGPETLHFTSTKAVTRYHKSLVSRKLLWQNSTLAVRLAFLFKLQTVTVSVDG